ncbi:hypothetical protein BCR41DRAFT_393664 [Lobosporangium transversale]|uniref:Uncharacterized protein n=1 Tax=Lobosporangium transversale TaxID=64571 RepID=A0A1Y2GW33_9FUNG|nr:hypothetical protein BCR41DRAFT_393664 [Lobosporangium transversale]ORZ26477.1 hypothetical protein BCR41DRAFT_393664 [Lobosporangium transversale]|eukprot:XP_021884242.1 hypothetical protein BCR41DRAFT_393664 [Lobosporangium transversale]
MKVSTQFLAACAIAFTTTALATPSMSKRIIDGSKVLGCFASVFMKGEEAWTPECATAATTDLGITQEAGFDDLTLDFTKPDLTLSSSVSVKLASLPGISLPVKKFSGHFAIIDGGVAIAKLTAPSTSAKVKGRILKFTLGTTALKTIPGQEDGISKFIETLVIQPSHTFTIAGNADVTIKIPGIPLLGGVSSLVSPSASSKTLTATNVGFSSPITLRGVKGFWVKYLSQKHFTRDSKSGITTLVYTANFHNPSQVNMRLGDTKYNVLNAKGELVGVINIPNLYLAMGDNVVTATTTFTNPDAYNALTTKSNAFTVVGFKDTVKNSILAKAMVGIKFQMTIPQIVAA